MSFMPQPRFQRAPIALAALLAVGLLGAAPAFAQSPGPAAAEATFAIALPAQPLGAALNELARQAGLQLLVRRELVAGKQAPAVSGRMTGAQALQRVLAGSGLVAAAEGSSVVVRQAPMQQSGEATLPAVTVTASSEPLPGEPPKPYAGGQVARGQRLGILGNQDFITSPFSQQSFTEQLIRDQQARTISDVLINEPSVRSNIGADASTDQFLIRGFRFAANNISFNGLYGLVDPRRAQMEGLERVELLRGFSDFLNGIPPTAVLPSGGVNLIPKRAADVPLTRFSSLYSSDANLGLAVDLGRRFGVDNAFGVRINASGQAGETFARGQDVGRKNLTVGADYRGEKLRISLDAGYQSQDYDRPGQTIFGIPAGFQIPRAPSARTSFHQVWEIYDLDHRFVTTRAELDVTDNITAHVAGGKSKHFEEQFSSQGSLINAAGDLRMSPRYTAGRTESDVADLGLRGTAITGPVKHSWSVGYNVYSRETGSTFTSTGPNFVTNIYAPISVAAPVRPDVPTPRDGTAHFYSAVLANTFSNLDDTLRLTLGVRRQTVKTASFNTTTGEQISSYDRTVNSPSAGILYRLTPVFSVYANYIEALSPGPTAPDTAANRGEVFDPVVSKQKEVGAKLDLGQLGGSFALFEATQPSAFTDPVSNRFDTNGEQRNRGIELNAFGELAKRTRLLGGVALLDGELTRTVGGTLNGKTAVGVPKVQANLGLEHDPQWLPGLTLTGRVIYTSSQFYDRANTQGIPSWTRVDFGARQSLKVGGQPLVLRLQIDNLLDRNYWQSTGAGFLTRGAPRTVRASVSIDL